MRTSFRIVLAWALLLIVGACSAPTVPDVTYYRLPPPAPLPRSDKPLSLLPIEVSTFRGEGIYSEQALIYATTPEAGALRAYHYQLWSESPSSGLQAHLIAMLREAGVSSLVTERLPASNQALRVRSQILHYERVKKGDSAFVASVAFSMRVEQDDGEPLLEQNYRAEQPAADAAMESTVKAFGLAVDQAFGAFYKDLVALRSGPHAG
ncbi:MAG TPA: ABC-type transport auxiliary lipoprotein family protein [Rudaea sp.]